MINRWSCNIYLCITLFMCQMHMYVNRFNGQSHWSSALLGLLFMTLTLVAATQKEVQLPVQGAINEPITETQTETEIKFTKTLSPELYSKPKEQAMYVFTIYSMLLC